MKKTSKLHRVGVLALFGGLAWGQRDLATITGTVTDQSGAIIQGARVLVTEIATGLSYPILSDTSGVFVRPALKPGTYTVEIEAQGFKKAIQRDVLLTAGDRTGVNVVLELGTTTEQVEVSASAALLQTENTNLGGNLNSRSTAELPLGAQRRVSFLARLSIGVLPQEIGVADNLGGGFSAAGLPSMGQNNFLLNGVDNNVNNTDYQGNAAYVVSVPPEAVGEVRVITNGANAEYGRGGGGVMDVTLKSGTNSFHGVLYEFLQNEKLNANSWDANKVGSPRGTYRQNQFGATVGGPIIRNRTFFFADYEGIRFNSFGGSTPGLFGAATLYTMPTPAETRGNFSALLAVGRTIWDPLSTVPDGKGGFTRLPFPGNIIPDDKIDPVARLMASQLPAPNQNLNAIIPGSNYFAAARAEQHNDQGNLRVDHRFTANDSLFGSLSWSNGSQTNPAPPGLSANSGSLAPGYLQTFLSRMAMLSYTRTWTPSLLSETRLAFTRSIVDREYQNHMLDANKTYGIPGYDPFNTSAGGGLPFMSPAGYSGMGSSGFTPALQYSNVWDFIQNVALSRGTHALKFGIEYRNVKLPSFFPNPSHGTMAFSRNMSSNPQSPATTGDGFASFLLGYDSSFTIATPNFNNQEHHSWSFYAQDDWKVTPKLTLNLGVRYELFSPWSDKWADEGNLIFNNDGSLSYDIPKGKDQNVQFPGGAAYFFDQAGIQVRRGVVDRYMIRWDKFDIGPRIGLAYQIRSKLVFRAGGGVFYSGEQNRGGFGLLDENPPFFENISYTGPTFTPNIYVPRISQGFPLNIFDLPIASSETIGGEAPNIDNPRVVKWNFVLQQELPWSSALEISYLGNYMSHLEMMWDPNMPPNSPNVPISVPFNSIRPHPGLGSVSSYLNSFGFGNYNALGLKFEKRLSGGLQYQAVYTWGHAIAAAPIGPWALGNGVGAPDARDMGSMYSSPQWDLRQNFVFGGLYELPFGKGKRFGKSWNPILDRVLGNWQLNGLLSLHTGHYVPLTTVNGVGYFGYAAGANRIYASVLPGRSANAAPSGGRTEDQWFDTSNIVAPVPYSQGNLGNSTNQLPAVKSLDFSVFKEIPINERFRVTLRGEAFNLFNTPNFATMGTTQGVAGFGQLLTTQPGSNRRMQIAARFVF
jgi:hypothetical protein